MNKKLLVTSAPHLREGLSIQKSMFYVNIALIPAMIAAVINFGFNSLFLTILGILSAAATEAVIQKLRKQPITISDGSAILTGVLVTFNIPPYASWWIPVLGSIFAIAVGKQIFGGLGFNPMNPALLGRAFLMASWPGEMTKWVDNSGKVIVKGVQEGIGNAAVHIPAAFDHLTTATPLALMKELRAVEGGEKIISDLTDGPALEALFYGNVGGVIGETSALALLLGALWLLYNRIIDWRIPASYIGTVALLSWIFGGEGLFSGNILFYILSGGLFLGAFYMATDWVTSPVTKNGRIYFGIGCGVLTVIIRFIGGYPEGVSYSILLMNLVVPLVNRYSKSKTYGEAK